MNSLLNDVSVILYVVLYLIIDYKLFKFKYAKINKSVSDREKLVFYVVFTALNILVFVIWSLAFTDIFYPLLTGKEANL